MKYIKVSEYTNKNKLKFIMLYNLTVIIMEIPKLKRILLITKNKPGSSILFKTRIEIILLISTKTVDTDR